jgi:hypothetical protein
LQDELEALSPPHRFRGRRPEALEVPTACYHGRRYFIRTDDAASIASAALITQSSVTHQININTDQRYVGLIFDRAPDGLWVTAPSDGGVTPPGYYMLFIVDGEGRPRSGSSRGSGDHRTSCDAWSRRPSTTCSRPQ